MRLNFTVGRPCKWSPLGLDITGLGQTYVPLVIKEITPRGLIDIANKSQARGSEHWRILQPGDIILSVNKSTKEAHGSDDMNTTLMVDRLLVFRIHRDDYDPWDVTRLPEEVPCKEPQGRCEVVQQGVAHTTCNHTRANAVRTNDME